MYTGPLNNQQSKFCSFVSLQLSVTRGLLQTTRTYPLQTSKFYLTFKYEFILFFHVTVSCPSGNLFYFYLIPTTILMYLAHQFSSVQSLSHVRLFTTPWTAARHISLSITNSWSLLKLMSIELVIPSNHLILCHPLLLHSVFPHQGLLQ